MAAEEEHKAVPKVHAAKVGKEMGPPAAKNPADVVETTKVDNLSLDNSAKAAMGVISLEFFFFFTSLEAKVASSGGDVVVVVVVVEVEEKNRSVPLHI